MKKSLLCSLCIMGLVFSACEQEQLRPNLPDCIANRIPDLAEEGNRIMVPIEIESVYSYKHNLKTYYELDYRVRGPFSEIFDKDCEYVCSPNSSTDCPDWVDIEDRKLIWQRQ
ncbi:MAG: hypothetical protein AAF927_31060 [Bacteroidota bacterium]